MNWEDRLVKATASSTLDGTTEDKVISIESIGWIDHPDPTLRVRFTLSKKETHDWSLLVHQTGLGRTIFCKAYPATLSLERVQDMAYDDAIDLIQVYTMAHPY